MIRPLLLAAAVTGLAAPAALAQALEGSAGAQQVSYRFKDQFGAGTQSGTLLSASVGLGVSRLRFGVSGVFGQVRDPGQGQVPRDLRTTAFSVGMQLADWIQVGLEAQARFESRDSARTLQRLGGPFARLLADFGGTGLQGLAELALFPLTSSMNTSELNLALRAAVGVRYSQLNGPMTFAVTYRFSRLDYRDVGGVTPLTQDEAIAVEIGIRKH